MKILLIGNYPHLKSQSMDRFTTMLYAGLKSHGYEVRLLKPPPVIGRLLTSSTRLGKWIGVYRPIHSFSIKFCKAAEWADVVHICDQANALYVPWLKEKPHLVTCHDMIAIRSAFGEIKEHRMGTTGKIYQRWILSGLKQSRYVACVAKKTREDLLRLTGLACEKVAVVRNGLNFPFRHMHLEEAFYHLNQIGLENIRPYFLHVGGNLWYKNRMGLIRIFSQLTQLYGSKRPYLVLAGDGMNSQLQALAEKLGNYRMVRSASSVSNIQLCALYNLAEGLIFPSLAEGFGWPIIEAQACGCPVFASNRRPITEVGGDGAVYFEPADEIGAAFIIREAVKNNVALKVCGYQNAMKYSAETMIHGYDSFYRSITM